MINVFEVHDPRYGNTVTARELLDIGASGIESELKDEPSVRARFMHTMGRAYRNLGQYDKARQLLASTGMSRDRRGWPLLYMTTGQGVTGRVGMDRDHQAQT